MTKESFVCSASAGGNRLNGATAASTGMWAQPGWLVLPSASVPEAAGGENVSSARISPLRPAALPAGVDTGRDPNSRTPAVIDGGQS